jgi:site-specific recombinase XerD
MPVEMVSKMLGHDNIGTTQIYLDINDDDMAAMHKRYVR